MRGLKLNRQNILCTFIYIFLLINLFRDKMPGGVNQLIGGVVVVFVVLNLLPLKKKVLLYFFYFLASASLALFTTDDINTHIKYTIYFILNISIFYLMIYKKNRDAIFNVIIRGKKTLRIIVTLFSLTITLMLLSNQCYSTDLWNGGRYFQGFSVPHGAAGSCCLAIAIISILISIDKKYKYIYAGEILVFLIAIVKAGTRTYLISAAAILLLVCCAFIRSKSLRRLIIVFGIAAFCLIVFNSESFQKKIEYSMSFQGLMGWNFLEAFTSSRTIIWTNDIMMFFEQSNPIQLLLGGGFAYSYELNASWTYRIQAHNGFIEVLLSTGILGFVMYLKLLIAYLKNASLNNKWYFVMLLLYVPVVVFWDDILQAPSYMMSFIFVCCEINYLEINENKNK